MIADKARNIKLLITDVDGVMTDGGMYFNSEGKEMKRFNSRDGYAVAFCRDHGIEYGIISSGHDANLVQARAKTLKIDRVYVGYTPKLEILNRWMDELDLKAEEIAYIGDDMSDLEVMKIVGLAACPADASNKIKEIAHIVLKKEGGQGCIREFVEDHLLPAV